MVSFGIGQAVRRVEDRRFLTGRGSYVDDIELPRQCHAVAVLSTHANARIKRIDVAAARAAPGVALVLTGVDALAEDIGGIPPHFMPEHWGGPKGFGTLRPVLLADRVRCVGDRVAFVVAETEAQARDAAELVEVEYDMMILTGRYFAPRKKGYLSTSSGRATTRISDPRCLTPRLRCRLERW